MAAVLTLTMNPAVDISTSTARVEPTHKLRCAAPQVHPGGGGINVARVIHRLGGEVRALYAGGGVTGEQLKGLLASEGVPAHCIAIAGETRESFSVNEQASGLDYRFVLPGPELAAAEWQACIAAAAAQAHGCGFVVASGSLSPGVPQDFYARLARRLARPGIPLVLDTSGEPLAAALEAGVHLVKPSLRELQELRGAALPDTDTRVAACRDLIARGAARIVALSLGEHGALLVTAEAAWQAPALRVPVASTIGAGDSLLGGLVWALGKGQPLEQALRQAVAASAAALLTAGTALAQAEDIERLLPQVVVTAA
jgi:6-phosphofructokinase 2